MENVKTMLEPGLRFGRARAAIRSEDAPLVTGAGRFTDDIDLPGQAHAAFVRAPVAHAAIVYLGSATLPANGTDDTGLLGELENGSPGNLAGGMGSAIAYSGVGQRYYMVPDRGPGDGSTGWIDRMYVVEVAIAPSGPGFTITPTLGHATLFSNEGGAYFTGRSSEFDATNSPASLRFDPEGLSAAERASLKSRADAWLRDHETTEATTTGLRHN